MTCFTPMSYHKDLQSNFLSAKLLPRNPLPPAAPLHGER